MRTEAMAQRAKNRYNEATSLAENAEMMILERGRRNNFGSIDASS